MVTANFGVKAGVYEAFLLSAHRNNNGADVNDRKAMAAEMAEYEGVTPEILRLKLATKTVGQQLIAMNVLKGASSLSNFKND